jgi:uridylate kinase
MFSEIIILKVGGSVLSVSEENFFNYNYALQLKKIILNNPTKQFILISGGGFLAKKYIYFLKQFNIPDKDLDFAGIYSNNLNAQLLRIALSDISESNILINESIFDDSKINFDRQVLVVGGSKPGQSGDAVAISIALKFNSKKIFILKDIDGVYSDNPKANQDAKRFDNLSWNEYKNIVGDQEFKPKMSLPIDPVATKMCIENGIEVVILKGEDLENLEKAIRRENFIGTIIKS